jgi:hypothetical protein
MQYQNELVLLNFLLNMKSKYCSDNTTENTLKLTHERKGQTDMLDIFYFKYVCIYIYIYTYICIHTYIYYTYICIHTYIYIILYIYISWKWAQCWLYQRNFFNQFNCKGHSNVAFFPTKSSLGTTGTLPLMTLVL